MGNQLMEQLLDKYFEGETSLDEEARLRDYFRSEEVEESLKPFQPLFRHLAQEQKYRLGAGFDQRLLRQLEAMQPEARVRRLTVRRRALRIAAAIMLALGMGWAYYTLNPALRSEPQVAAIDWSKYEVQSTEEAFRLTSAALLKASSELNHGASTAAYEMDKLKKVGKFFK